MIQKKPSVAANSSGLVKRQDERPEVPRRGPGRMSPPQDLYVVLLAGRTQPHNRTTSAPAVERIAAGRASDRRAKHPTSVPEESLSALVTSWVWAKKKVKAL